MRNQRRLLLGLLLAAEAGTIATQPQRDEALQEVHHGGAEKQLHVTGEEPDRMGLTPGDFSEVEQAEGMPKVVTDRAYVFITHHKSGTNLMQQLCNFTAMLVTDGRDQCAYCLRLKPPTKPGGRPSCWPNPVPIHGPLRGTFSRFTLVSSMNMNEFSWLPKDIRAVHMIRDPKEMALSAYAWNTFLALPEGQRYAWDASAHFKKRSTLEQRLEVEAEAIAHPAVEMLQTHLLTVDDNRVLSLDLETFAADFNSTARRFFDHLFDNPPEEQLTTLLWVARSLDVHANNSRLKPRGTTAAKLFVNMTEAKMAWDKLAEAGNSKVKSVMDLRVPLGYGP